MSVQATFNQAIALTAGLMSLNPSLQQKAQDRKAIKAAELEETRATSLMDQAIDSGNKAVADEQKQRLFDATKKKAETDPEKYGWEYIMQQDVWNDAAKRKAAAEKDATASYISSSSSISNLKYALDQRENLLKGKHSMRQMMKADGFSSREIREAYSDKKRGNR